MGFPPRGSPSPRLRRFTGRPTRVALMWKPARGRIAALRARGYRPRRHRAIRRGERPSLSSEESGSQMRAQLLIVVPTYEEASNVPPLIARIDEVRRARTFDVLVVDDRSPDGTADLVRQFQDDRAWLHLLERPRPMGLGSAYRDGFAWGRSFGYDRIGEMDADLSHDPATIPALDDAVRSGASLAIGSRYVDGGGTQGWPWHRRILSRGANRFARSALRLPTRDVTAGFRIYDRTAIDVVLGDGTDCDGYGFQVECVALVTRAGLDVREVPIVFRDREHGSSKMSMSTIVEAAGRCLDMSLEHHARRAITVAGEPRPVAIDRAAGSTP